MPTPPPIPPSLHKIPSLLPTLGSAKTTPGEFTGSVKTIIDGEVKPASAEAKQDNEVEELKEESKILGMKGCQWEPLRNMQTNAQCGCVSFINKYLDELYVCKKPTQLQKLINNIKRVCKQCTSNNAFITVYQKIKAHISLMRQALYNRLWELQILQKVNKANFHLIYRYHQRLNRSRSDELYYHYDGSSTGGIKFEDPYFCNMKQPSLLCDNDMISVVQHSGKVSRNYVCIPYEEAAEKYAKFVGYICQFYRELNNQNIERLEALCKELLKSNQPPQESTQYNIHKSLFERRILKDCIIRV